MAAQAETDVVALELERVLPALPTLFDREGPFFNAIEKRPVEIISNRQMRIPQEIRPGGKFGYFNPDGGDLGRGGSSVFDKAVISPAHIRYAVEYTTLTGWVTDSNKKAIVNNIQRTLSKSMAEMRRHCDGQAVGAGDGVIATIESFTSGAGTTTAILDQSYGAKLLRFGQDFSLYSSDLLTLRAGGEKTITFHDLANRTVKFLDIAAEAIGDKLVASGLTALPPVGIKGVLYHHSNSSVGFWLGYDRSTNPEIRANRVNAGGSAFSLPLARLAINKAADRVGLDQVGNCQAWMHPAQADSYEQLGQLVTMITSSGEGKGLDRYFGGQMTMAGAPVKKSFNWHRKRIDFIDMNYWGRGELHPISFYTPPGGNGQKVWEVRASGGGIVTSNIFYIVASFDLFVTNPAGCSYIDTLAIPNGY